MEHEIEVEIENHPLKLSYQLDKLNQRYEIPIDDSTLYVSTFTDGFTKVLRFSDQD